MPKLSFTWLHTFMELLFCPPFARLSGGVRSSAGSVPLTRRPGDLLGRWDSFWDRMNHQGVNGFRKIDTKGRVALNLIFRSECLPSSVFIVGVISLEWDRGPWWGPLISCSTGGHLIYVQIFPVSGNLLPVKEGLLDGSLYWIETCFHLASPCR